MSWSEMIFWGVLATLIYCLFASLATLGHYLKQINANLSVMNENIEQIKTQTSPTGLGYVSREIESERERRKAMEEEMMAQEREYG